MEAAGEEAQEVPSQTVPKDEVEAVQGGAFVIAPEMPYRANLRTTGIFVNAFHVPENPEEVRKTLEESKGQKYITVIVCRGDQKDALTRYRPLADEFIMEDLFLYPEAKEAGPDDLIWPGFSHPMVNYLREIRLFGQGLRIIVAVPMTTREVWGASESRTESFEELEWMSFAAIGANYQGILWGHERYEDWWKRRLAAFEAALKRHAEGLASASPVGWVSASEGQPFCALASKDTLFVVLLNPDYMGLTADGKGIAVPLDPGARTCRIRVSPPEGRRIESASTLDGRPLDLENEGGVISVSVRYSGGGEMAVLQLLGDGPAPAQEPQ